MVGSYIRPILHFSNKNAAGARPGGLAFIPEQLLPHAGADPQPPLLPAEAQPKGDSASFWGARTRRLSPRRPEEMGKMIC